MHGIDISSYQTNVDYNALKASGVDFAIIRAGFGNCASQKDRMFETHINGCIDAGIDVGIYWFNYATSEEEARQEARVCMDIIKPYWGKISYPIFSDWEYDSMNTAHKNGIYPDKELISKVVYAFCNELEDNGYWAGVYVNKDYYKNYTTDSLKVDKSLWLADYVNYDRKPTYPCYIHQYSSEAHENGYNGNIDVNTCFVDFPKMIREAGRNGYTAPQPEPVDEDMSYLENAPDTRDAQIGKLSDEIAYVKQQNADLQRRNKMAADLLEQRRTELMGKDSQMRGLTYQIETLTEQLKKLKDVKADDTIVNQLKELQEKVAEVKKILDD